MNRLTRWHLLALLALPACAVAGQAPVTEASPPVATAPPATDSTVHTAPAGSSEPVVLIGAGDIAGCETDGDFLTAEILDSIPGIVFTVGDHAYPTGTARQWSECYNRAWGRHKERTKPSPGNHDYMTRNGAPYFDYFGELAGERGKGWYAYDAGSWRVIVLNSEVDTHRGSQQERWLRAELAANPRQCIMAYWHKPLFSSVREERRVRSDVRALWNALYDAGADLVVNGHDHVYERYAKQTPAGRVDPERGIRQIIVGTGGRSLYPFSRPGSNSEVADNSTYGLLKLTLHDGRYEWEFIPAFGGDFRDSGSDQCH